MSDTIPVRPLTAAAFAAFGEVLDASGPPDLRINAGKCERFHDRAQLDFFDTRAGISIFRSACFSLPYRLAMVERHPDGSQAFICMSNDPFLVIVAADANGKPSRPLAFLTNGAQAINIQRNVWHGVLTPLSGPGLFAVVDRIGPTRNLEEHEFVQPFIVTGG